MVIETKFRVGREALMKNIQLPLVFVFRVRKRYNLGYSPERLGRVYDKSEISVLKT